MLKYQDEDRVLLYIAVKIHVIPYLSEVQTFHMFYLWSYGRIRPLGHLYLSEVQTFHMFYLWSYGRIRPLGHLGDKPHRLTMYSAREVLMCLRACSKMVYICRNNSS